VDDELKALNLEKFRQRGPDSGLAGSEVITIALVGDHLGLDRDAREFPGLTGVHRTTLAGAFRPPEKGLLRRMLGWGGHPDRVSRAGTGP
jgi:hypothetical protein